MISDIDKLYEKCLNDPDYTIMDMAIDCYTMGRRDEKDIQAQALRNEMNRLTINNVTGVVG